METRIDRATAQVLLMIVTTVVVWGVSLIVYG